MTIGGPGVVAPKECGKRPEDKGDLSTVGPPTPGENLLVNRLEEVFVRPTYGETF